MSEPAVLCRRLSVELRLPACDSRRFLLPVLLPCCRVEKPAGQHQCRLRECTTKQRAIIEGFVSWAGLQVT
jgi:hypothetical protein